METAPPWVTLPMTLAQVNTTNYSHLISWLLHQNLDVLVKGLNMSDDLPFSTCIYLTKLDESINLPPLLIIAASLFNSKNFGEVLAMQSFKSWQLQLNGSWLEPWINTCAKFGMKCSSDLRQNIEKITQLQIWLTRLKSPMPLTLPPPPFSGRN